MPAWGAPPPLAEAALDLQPELAAAELVLELELQQEPELAVLELRPEQGRRSGSWRGRRQRQRRNSSSPEWPN